MKQDGTLGKLFPVKPLRVNYVVQMYQKYVWFQDGISLEEHILVVTLQLGQQEKIN